MTPRKGKSGDSHWFVDFVWDFVGCLIVGTVLVGICIWVLWIAGELVSGVIE